MNMKIQKTYTIDISNIDGETFDVDFTIENAFFSALEQSLIEKGNLVAHINLYKTQGVIKAVFHIEGTVELTCDRTLNVFDYPINSINTILYKFSDKDDELTDEIMLIRHDTAFIDVAPVLFDFIALQIPLKKIHPDFLLPQDDESNDDILIYSSVNDEKDLTDSNIDILDPRWEALKKLKDTF
jgi:uncharacterized protein